MLLKILRNFSLDATIDYYDHQVKPSRLKEKVVFLHKRITPATKLIGQLQVKGGKLHLNKQLFTMYRNWKLTYLGPGAAKLSDSGFESSYQDEFLRVPFLNNYSLNPRATNIGNALFWRVIQFNVMFRLEVKASTKKRDVRVKYIPASRRSQVIWKWLGLFIKLEKKNKYTYSHTLLKVIQPFLLTNLEEHDFTKLKNKIYRVYLLQ